jgi:hypothetical protein
MQNTDVLPLKHFGYKYLNMFIIKNYPEVLDYIWSCPGLHFQRPGCYGDESGNPDVFAKEMEKTV